MPTVTRCARRKSILLPPAKEKTSPPSIGARQTKKGPPQWRPFLILARPAGFEPTTPWFVAKYSIQLSYGRCKKKTIAWFFLTTQIHHTIAVAARKELCCSDEVGHKGIYAAAALTHEGRAH